MRDSCINSFSITPGYAGGFLYEWRVDGGFNDPGPWFFTVQEGMSESGPWRDLSCGLKNVMFWMEPCKRHLVGKSNVLFFRLELKTPNGTYFSHVAQPYGDLSRRHYLLAREIMRREVLRANVLSGVECDVYIKSTFGPRCTHCIDPVTGYVRDSHCKWCFGTGRYPAYLGPHRMLLSFGPDAQHTKTNDVYGTHEDKILEAVAIGNPVLKKGDVVVDVSTDKRYVIGVCSITSEVRRVACIQHLMFEEAALSDSVYSIGSESGLKQEDSDE